MEIIALTSLPAPQRRGAIERSEQIFFETATRRDFGSRKNRAAFRARWFGRYTELHPAAFLTARDDRGEVLGYLAGCFDSFASENGAILADLGYYTADRVAKLREHPAHFHINVLPAAQRRGIGRLLLADFVSRCATAGCPGIHVVTAAASPAVKFYEAVGFRAPAGFNDDNSHLAFLTRAVSLEART
jgi:GNAT superfamily N-acetyltransferase